MLDVFITCHCTAESSIASDSRYNTRTSYHIYKKHKISIIDYPFHPDNHSLACCRVDCPTPATAKAPQYLLPSSYILPSARSIRHPTEDCAERAEKKSLRRRARTAQSHTSSGVRKIHKASKVQVRSNTHKAAVAGYAKFAYRLLFKCARARETTLGRVRARVLSIPPSPAHRAINYRFLFMGGTTCSAVIYSPKLVINKRRSDDNVIRVWLITPIAHADLIAIVSECTHLRFACFLFNLRVAVVRVCKMQVEIHRKRCFAVRRRLLLRYAA